LNKTCPECSTPNPSESKFCSECATPLEPGLRSQRSYTRTFETPTQDLARGQVIAGRYEVIEELGRGGMGQVFRVEDTKVGQEIALKLINPGVDSDKKNIERFRSELRIARMISHRNVCRMFDLGESDGKHYITMEYIKGEDLKRMIRMSGQLSPGTAVKTAIQICRGLSEAHHLGVIHRDLKPSNIMIDRQGQARILDFGIARSRKTEGLTGEGMMVGTPEYMSPEQAEAETIDHRSDIYSLGVMMYEMLTGRVPFEGHTPLSIAMQHKSDRPTDPSRLNSQISGALSSLILKCLAKDPDKRFGSAEELASALEEISGDLPSSETAARRKKTTSKEITLTIAPRKIWLWVVLAAIVVTAGIFWALRPREETVHGISDKPSIAVMYFKNNTGETTLDHWRTALTDLLITDLSQSQLVRVLSAERLYHALEQLDGLDATTFSSEMLIELGKRTRVNTILVGNYSMAGGEFRINISLQDAATGELLSSRSVQGTGEQSLYTMVDELTLHIKGEFQLSPSQIAADTDRKIEAITTRSPEALKHYVEGRKLHLRGEYPRSISAMQKALEIDPNFAMAYRSLSSTYTNMGFAPASRNAIQKAFELIGNVSDRERYQILGGYYSQSEKTLDKAVDAYQKCLDLYPDESVARSNLGLTYIIMEEWDKAEAQYLANIQADYEGWISHWNLAEIYEAMGRYRRAREIIQERATEYPEDARFPAKIADIFALEGEYEKALEELERTESILGEIDPGIHKRRGDIALLQGNFEQAESMYSEFREGLTLRRNGLFVLYLARGRFEEAIRLMQEKPVQTNQIISIFLRTGRYAEALELIDKAGESVDFSNMPSLEMTTAYQRGLARIEMGDAAGAEEEISRITELVPESNSAHNIRYSLHLRGMIALRGKEYRKAIRLMSQAYEHLFYPNTNSPSLHPFFLYFLGEAQAGAGDFSAARETYEKLINLGSIRLEYGDFYAKSFYQLARISERRNDKSGAKSYYRRFLDLWKYADDGLAETADAAERIGLN